jgi:UDP-4-amino-4-deoxy-L-arabinose-oxoglutarate aminotransferase
LILHSKPWLTDDDVDAMSAVVRSGMVAQGARTEALERELAAWVGAGHGIGVASGSAAILLALRALGIGAGDDVVLPTYVCSSVMEAAAAAGATPILCDVGDDWVMTPGDVAAAITKTTKAIIVPHMYGIYADIEAFRQFGVAIVEDCAQAVAGRGEKAIAGDAAVFSFHPTKCLTSGEGGMVVTNDAGVAARAKLLRDGNGTGGREVFSPLSDIAAALASSQLARYGEALRIRREIAGDYFAVLGDAIDPHLRALLESRSMFFRFVLRVPSFDAAARAFAAEGVIVRKGVDLLLHRLAGLGDERFPKSTELFETTVSLPIYPALTGRERAVCAAAAAKVLAPAPRAALVAS